jgi:methylated-DNA-[protein]-cysteine S-methyltransferase
VKTTPFVSPAPSGPPLSSPFVAPTPRAVTLYGVLESPIGELLVTGDGNSLTGLYMLDGPGGQPAVGTDWIRDAAAFRDVAAQLGGYFAGGLKEFDVPLAPSGSAFQLAVWAELTRIPYGSTASYGDVAQALGKSPVASRAVGAANGRNPISIIVPCHRVIGADGSLTGYGGGLDRKEHLLRLEGGLPEDTALW